MADFRSRYIVKRVYVEISEYAAFPIASTHNGL